MSEHDTGREVDLQMTDSGSNNATVHAPAPTAEADMTREKVEKMVDLLRLSSAFMMSAEGGDDKGSAMLRVLRRDIALALVDYDMCRLRNAR